MVAMADGNLTQKEKEFLEEKAGIYNISSEKLREMRRNPDKIKMIFPQDLGDRLQLLYELAEMALIDHVTSPEEIETCRSIATKMDIIPESVDQILRDLGKRTSSAPT